MIRGAILLKQIVIIAKIERPHRACVNTTRVFALIDIIRTQITFTHYAFFRIKLRGAIRTNPGTVLAANT